MYKNMFEKMPTLHFGMEILNVPYKEIILSRSEYYKPDFIWNQTEVFTRELQSGDIASFLPLLSIFIGQENKPAAFYSYYEPDSTKNIMLINMKWNCEKNIMPIKKIIQLTNIC